MIGFGAAGRATAVALPFVAFIIFIIFMAPGLLDSELLLRELPMLPERPLRLGLLFKELVGREGLLLVIVFGAGLVLIAVFIGLLTRPRLGSGFALGPEDGRATAAGLFLKGSLFIGIILPPDAGRFFGDMATKLGLKPQ